MYNLTGIDITKESEEEQSLAIKLYSVGTMYDKIIEEKKQINLNNIKYYSIYISILLGFIIVIGIILYVNKKIYNNDNNIGEIFYNILISLVLFIIFILIISFVIFINIGNNIDTNPIQVKFLKAMQEMF